MLIGKACKTDLISLKKRFILATSNALAEYLLLLDSDDRKLFLESIKLLLIDEIDALFKLPNKYNQKKIELWSRKKTQFYNILQAILAVNKNKTQIIAASATLNRTLSRTLDSIIHTFKKGKKTGNMVYIRVEQELEKSETTSGNVQLYYHVCDNFDDEIDYLSKIVTNETLIFANHNYSLIKIRESLLSYGIEVSTI